MRAHTIHHTKFSIRGKNPSEILHPCGESAYPGPSLRGPRTGRVCHPGHRRRRNHHRIRGRGHQLARGARPPSTRPQGPQPHLLLLAGKRRRDRRALRRQLLALDQPLLRRQLRGRRGRGPRFHQGPAQHQSRRRAELRLRPHHRRALHQEAQGRIPLLVRQQELPRNAPVPETMTPPRGGSRRLPLKGATPVARQSRFHGVSGFRHCAPEVRSS